MSENTSAKQLFNLLTVHNFEDLQGLDSATNKPPVNDQGKPDLNDADMFTFNWNAESGKDYGTVVILLNNDHGMDVFFGDNMGKTMEQEDKQEWFDFLLQLKQFATKNFLEFNPQNLNKLRYSLAGQAAIKEGLFESWKGNATTSWNDEPTQARLMVRHKKRIGEGDARYRYIESMFVETAEGERYRLPFTRLSGGRAMVEHVRQGGKPYDLRGQHIVGMVEELNVLSRFRRANLGKIFEGDTQGLVTEANAYYENLNRMMSSLSKSRGYETYFENWNPEEITQQDMVIEDIKTLFVEQNLDTRIEAALPILARIQQGNAMKEAKIFETWANNVMEGTWSTPDTPEKQQTLISLLSAELPVGADATNATELLYDLIGDDTLFDQLHDLADDDANADARQLVFDRLQELADQDPSIANVLSQLNVDMDSPEVSDMDMDAESDQDLEEAEQDTSELDAEFGHGPYDSEIQGTRTATKHPDGQTDLEQTIQSTDTNAKGMTRSNFTQQKGNDVSFMRHYHGVMEGSIRDGVWSADPPPAGGKNVPPPSPNEGPTSSTPTPKAPAPKAPMKKADSDEMEIAEFSMPGKTQYINTASGKSSGSLDAALTPPAGSNASKTTTKPADTKAAPAKTSDSGEGDAIAEYSAISRMTQGKPADTAPPQSMDEEISRLSELAGTNFASSLRGANAQRTQANLDQEMSGNKGAQTFAMPKDDITATELDEKLSIDPDAGPVQQTITPSGSEVWSNKPAGTPATPPAPGTNVPSNIKPPAVPAPAVPAPANNFPNFRPFGSSPPLGPDGKPMQLMPMDEEYEAYDDDLAQILKRAGVNDTVIAAPDYETGVAEGNELSQMLKHAGVLVKESMLTDSTGETLDHILNRFKNEVKRFQNGDEIDTELYYALFDYYNDHGEMPYGVAKARDGDPVNWITDRLTAELGIDEGMLGVISKIGRAIKGAGPDAKTGRAIKGAVPDAIAAALSGSDNEPDHLANYIKKPLSLEDEAANYIAKPLTTEEELDEIAMLVPMALGAAARAVPAVVRSAPVIMRSAEKLIGGGRTAAAGAAGGAAAKSLPGSTSSAAGSGSAAAAGGAGGAAADRVANALGGSNVPSDDGAVQRYIAKPLSLEESSCNMTMEGEYCPEHGLEECGMYEGDFGLTLTPTTESQDFDLARLRKLAFGK